MDTLPVEILQAIFVLACTDGGATGNALSLTSKGIRAAARPIRFHSIHLAVDRAPFQEFASFFAREWDDEDGNRPRVRHLSLDLGGRVPPPQSLLPIGSVPGSNAPSHPAVARLPSDLSTRGPRRKPPHPPTAADSQAVQKLLSFVARDLQSLVVHVGPLGIPAGVRFPIFEHTFPLVREAAFLGFSTPALLISRANAEVPPTNAVALIAWVTPDLPPALPAAMHIHVSPNPNDLQRYEPSWVKIAPNVALLSHVGFKLQTELIATMTRYWPDECLTICVRVPPAAILHGDIPARRGPRLDGGQTAALRLPLQNVPFREHGEQRFKEWVERIDNGEGLWVDIWGIQPA
ncbi:hypothetical protein C2E23DRAFT_844679 [Lenzites betulinus]|nr:hypothetical protein C2E23DRAFT_844679 [Lenzites betulinus]